MLGACAWVRQPRVETQQEQVCGNPCAAAAAPAQRTAAAAPTCTALTAAPHICLLGVILGVDEDDLRQVGCKSGCARKCQPVQPAALGWRSAQLPSGRHRGQPAQPARPHLWCHVDRRAQPCVGRAAEVVLGVAWVPRQGRNAEGLTASAASWRMCGSMPAPDEGKQPRFGMLLPQSHSRRAVTPPRRSRTCCSLASHTSAFSARQSSSPKSQILSSGLPLAWSWSSSRFSSFKSRLATPCKEG